MPTSANKEQATEVRTSRIGGYDLLEPLDSSVHGRVYRARCAVIDRPNVARDQIVALKTLHRVPRGSKDATRFELMAKLLLAASHPNIVRHLDAFKWRAGEEEILPCVVMEMLDGDSLAQLVRRTGRPLERAQLASVCRQSLEGLIFAADRNILPRYFDPSKILLLRGGEVKLVGFGLPRLGKDTGASLAGGERFFDYMAPDLLDPEQAVTGSAYVFSFAVCIFEAATGALPFPVLEDRTAEGDVFGSYASAYQARWTARQRPRPVFDHEIFRTAPKLQGLLARALEPSADKRYRSFAEMRSELDAALQQLAGPRATPPPPATQPVPIPAQPAVQRRRIPVHLAWLSLLLLTTLAGYVVFHRAPEPAGIEETPVPVAASSSPAESPPSPPPPPPVAEPLAPPLIRMVSVSVRLEPLAAVEPPVSVFVREHAKASWVLLEGATPMNPGVYETKFHRPDFVPIVRRVEIPSGVDRFEVQGPAPTEWVKGSALQVLEAWKAAAPDARRQDLERFYAQTSQAPMEWPPYAEELAALRAQWEAALQEERAEALRRPLRLDVRLPVLDAQAAPITVSLRLQAGEKWVDLTGPVRIRPGHYEVRFSRPDYLPISRELDLLPGSSDTEIPAPEETKWHPKPALAELLMLEKAWAAGDTATVTKRLAQPSLPDLEWPGHAARMKDLRGRWFNQVTGR